MKIATITLNPAIDKTVAIPGFQIGEVNRVQSSESNPGGKGVNVASFLADYGFSMMATGFLGMENTGLFETLFQNKGIEDRFIRIPGSTRTGIKIVDPVTKETTDINFPGQTPERKHLEELFHIVGSLAEACEWVVIAGSIPPDTPDSICQTLVETINQHDGKSALDTSGAPFAQALEAKPNFIKPNIHELEEYVGRSLDSEIDVISAAESLIIKGIETVAVSMGSKGAIFIEANEKVLVKPMKVQVKSTVGAGDAMVSGTIAGKSMGHDLTECARLATAFSINAITRIGTDIESKKSIEDIAKKIEIIKL